MEPRNVLASQEDSFDLTGKIVNVLCGQNESATVIKIHESVLSKNSEFFKRIIKPEWAALRDDADTIDLSMHTATDVKTYCHFLYSGHITTRPFDTEGTTRSDPIWIDLAHAYVFGEKMMDARYKRSILETLAAYQVDAPDFPCAEAFQIVYEGTPEGSPMRRLLVDMYAYGAYDADDWKAEFEALPQEAVVDVLVATVVVRRENEARPWGVTLEAYQEREAGGEGS